MCSIVGFIFLLSKTSLVDHDYKFISVLIFCLSSIMVYASSTTYHYNWNKPSRNTYRTIDHIMIYYLIAGTYTPFMLITFDPEKGWVLFMIVWVIAFLGTIFKFFYTGKFHKLSMTLYILLGWTILLEFQEFIASTPKFAFNFLMAGGLLYTVGVIFYAKQSWHFNHVKWHLFVMGGNFCHFLAVWSIL